MPMRFARKSHLSVDSLSRGLEALEARRVLDGASCTPACEEMFEITSLDGAESFWVRADDSDYGIIDCEDADAAGSDTDIYSFTTRPAAANQREEVAADEPGDDHDLYDFGQDRGPEIDDEAEYQADEEPEAEPAAVVETDLSSAPRESSQIDIAESAPEEPVSSEPAPIQPIALIPGASGISWIGESDVVSSTGQLGDQAVEEVSPASWTDLVALAEPVIVVQP